MHNEIRTTDGKRVTVNPYRVHENEGTPRRPRVFVNDERTVLVEIWEEEDQTFVTVATREHRGDTWGPPVWTNEEKRS